MSKTITNEEYERIVTKMKKCIDEYRKVMNAKYSLGLANGDAIDIIIPYNRLAHLLGLKVDFFRKEALVKNDASAGDILNYFLDKCTYYSLSKKIGRDRISEIFSEYVEQKLDCFINNISIKKDDMVCIVKYDSEKTYQVSNIVEKPTHYIIRQVFNKYYVLGLIQAYENNNRVLTPVTSRIYDDFYSYEEFMKRICNKQEITYPYMLKRIDRTTDSEVRPYIFKTSEKKVMLDRIVKMGNRYGAVVSSSKDYLNFINRALNKDQNDNNKNLIIRLLTEAIKNNTLLEEEEIDEILGDNPIDEEVKELIDTYNNLACSRSMGNNDAIDNSYSSIQDENGRLKEELKAMKEELELLKQAQQEKEETITTLEENNQKMKKKINIMEDAYNQIKLV